MALLQANDMVHWKCWCILGVPMRGLSQLSWYLQRLPWAFDKTYLGSRLQALAEGRSNVLRGCAGYATNTMSGQEQEVGLVCPACEHVILPATCSDCVRCSGCASWLQKVT